jgi:hypothetical protein
VHSPVDAEPDPSLSGEPVDVYRNLNRPGRVWSVRSRRSGLVVARVTAAVVRDVTLVCQPGGRARARRTGVRNVHAFIRGTLCSSAVAGVDWRELSYDPFGDDPFQCDARAVDAARWARVGPDGAFVAVASGR